MNLDRHRHPIRVSRRDMLQNAGAGFGSLALASLLGRSQARGSEEAAPPLGQPHHPPRADSVIFLFMEGGPSHLDLFDPKPLLREMAGQQLPASFGKPITAMGEADSPLLADKRKWAQHGEGGIWISDWLPEHAAIADDITVIRSCWTNGINHSGGVCQMNTGSARAGKPSLGAWVSYGLGTENDDLPAFVVMEDNPGKVVNGPRNWGTAFMPAEYQGVAFRPGEEPVRHLQNPKGVDVDRQRAKLDLLYDLNQTHLAARESYDPIEARIESFELAYRMQAEAPEAVDLSQETEETKKLYGMDDEKTKVFGSQCLLARRLVERGVRFVQLYHGSGSKWDAHSGIEANHSGLCAASDKPAVALVKDLKRRGLLDRTLVVWGGEFGRTPMSEQGNGRDHNPTGFTMWMAGAGLVGGRTIGATDELGLRAVEDPLHVHDIHATILHLMGLDRLKLQYVHQGRPERPTQNEGAASESILG